MLTPEDDYAEWPDGTGTFIVPMFLLFDYSFRPPDVVESEAVRWARAAGVGSGDEQMLSPSPWPSIAAWCHARCDATMARSYPTCRGTNRPFTPREASPCACHVADGAWWPP